MAAVEDVGVADGGPWFMSTDLHMAGRARRGRST
jgi:hypothetical protein